MDAITEKFLAALHDLHRNGEVEPIVDLFADDAVLTKAGLPHQEHGKQGARTFWQSYRDVFDSIEASFQHSAGDDRIAFLEWTSFGTLRDGSDFRYDGVSVLEADGDTIDAFRTYYDTSAFLTGTVKS